MKTAISIPDPLNQNIDDFLKVSKMSRSEFFQRAARLYLERTSAKAALDNLNQVYGEKEDSGETVFRHAALSHFRDLMGKEQW